MSTINAKEALGQYKLNAIKYEAEASLEKLQKIKAEKERQDQIDAEWIQHAIIAGGRIIESIINDGPKLKYCSFGLGKKNKHNGYICKFKSGVTQLQHYEFFDFISDNAAEYIEKYYKDNGYGCEVVKPVKKSDWGYDNKEPGTMYLWIPTEEDEKQLDFKNGICW